MQKDGTEAGYRIRYRGTLVTVVGGQQCQVLLWYTLHVALADYCLGGEEISLVSGEFT